MVDLDNATRQYGADTGATADQQARAAQIANQFFATNTAGYKDILGVMGALQTEQGLTQDGAKNLTQQYLDFSKVTGEDATGAVKSFDDILDAWGLQASDAKGIMDQLIASHEKYGGSIEANQTALAQLAPALRASNTSIDEAIGFLNLAASSGLDAASATGALNHAVKELKPGQTFDDLVKQISAIPDPTLRAQKAIEVFGRQGAALANAFQPGIDGLQQFEITAPQAAGALDKSAADIKGSIQNQVITALHGLQSTLVDVLGPAGPILTGVGGITAMVNGLRQMGVVIPGAAAAMKALGLTSKETAAATKEAAVAEALAGTEAEATGTKMGGLKGTLLGIGPAIAIGLVPVVLGVLATLAADVDNNLAKIQSDIDRFSESFNVASLIKTYQGIAEQIKAVGDIDPFGEKDRLIAEAHEIQAALEQHGVAVRQVATIDQGTEGYLFEYAGKIFTQAQASAGALDDLIKKYPTAGSSITSAFGPAVVAINSVATATSSMATNVDENTASAGDAFQKLQQVAGLLPAGVRSATNATSAVLDTLATNVAERTAAAADAFNSMQPKIAASLQTMAVVAKQKTTAALDAIVQTIHDNRQKPVDEMAALVEAMKHPLSTVGETTRLIGELASKNLVKGLQSGDPAVRAQAEATKKAILDRLDALAPATSTVTKKAMAELVAAMHSKDAEVRSAAQGIYNDIQTRLNPLAADARRWGAATGDSFITGLANSIKGGTALIVGAIANIKGPLEAHSPPKEGPFKDIVLWARATGLAWVEEIARTIAAGASTVKAGIAKVAAEVQSTIANYKGIAGLMPSAAPEDQVSDLRGYIASLTTELAKTTDPTQRLAIEQKIADYQSRITDLMGKVGTSDQQAIDTLQGYVANLDKALLGETDPTKRQAIADKITEYLQRITTINGEIDAKAASAAKAAADAKNAPTPGEQDAAAAQAKLDALELQKIGYQRQLDALSLTDDMKQQNSVAIDSLNKQIAAIQAQEDQISGAQKQLQITSDYVDQLKIAGASADRITAAINDQIAAQQALNALTGGGGAASGGTGGAGGTPNLWPNGAVSKVVMADGSIVWTFPDGHKETTPANLNGGIGSLKNNPDSGFYGLPSMKNGTGNYAQVTGGGASPNTNGGPAGGIHVDKVEINNPLAETATESFDTLLRRRSYVVG
jgi:hypothetical protein